MNKIVLVDKQSPNFGGPPKPPAKIVPLSDFDDLQRDISRYGRICKDLDQTEREITAAIKYFSPEGHLAKLLEQADRLLARYEQQTPERERLKKDLEAFNPEDDPECDGGAFPNRRHVAKQIGLLLGAFPSGSPADPAVYTSMMIEEVLGANRTKLALESAVRTARRTLKFLPTISEVLAILKTEENNWDERLNEFYCDIEVESLQRAVTAARERIAEIQNKKETKRQRELAAHTFAVGDPVAHLTLGAGNIVSVVDGTKCIVKFDKKDTPTTVVHSFLEHRTVSPFDA
jgi:hypothetical protein